MVLPRLCACFASCLLLCFGGASLLLMGLVGWVFFFFPVLLCAAGLCFPSLAYFQFFTTSIMPLWALVHALFITIGGSISYQFFVPLLPLLDNFKTLLKYMGEADICTSIVLRAGRRCWISGAKVTGSCDPPSVGNGNQTQVLWKNSHYC